MDLSGNRTADIFVSDILARFDRSVIDKMEQSPISFRTWIDVSSLDLSLNSAINNSLPLFVTAAAPFATTWYTKRPQT